MDTAAACESGQQQGGKKGDGNQIERRRQQQGSREADGNQTAEEKTTVGKQIRVMRGYLLQHTAEEETAAGKQRRRWQSDSSREADMSPQRVPIAAHSTSILASVPILFKAVAGDTPSNGCVPDCTPLPGSSPDETGPEAGADLRTAQSVAYGLHSHALFLTLNLSLSFSLSLSHPVSLTQFLTQSLTLSLSHSVSHTQSLSLSLSHSVSLTQSLTRCPRI